MSLCPERDRLLRAEPGELRASSPSALAGHLATCAECRADADRILAANRTLDTALSDAPPFDADALVARALEPTRTPSSTQSSTPRSRRGLRRPRPAAWAPLLAAAVLAGLLLLRGPDPAPPPGPRPAALAPPDFSAPEGTDFAVFATADPDITVVWIFQGE